MLIFIAQFIHKRSTSQSSSDSSLAKKQTNTKMVATRRSKAAAPPVEEDDVSTSSSEHVANDNDDNSSSGSDDDSEASGSAQDMSEDDDDASSSDEEMDDDTTNQQHSATTDDDINDDTNNTEQCTFDLHNLLAFNTHQINAAELYQSKKKSLNKEWYTNTPTIDSSTTKANQVVLPTVNENLLLSKAAEGTTQLLCELWKLPSEKTDVGLVSKLPSPEVKLPRALVRIVYACFLCVLYYFECCLSCLGNCLASFVLEHIICHIFYITKSNTLIQKHYNNSHRHHPNK